MKRYFLIIIISAISIITPISAFAFNIPLNSWQNGVFKQSQSVSVSTGGQNVSAGGNINTGGDTSVSVETHTVIRSGNNGGTEHVNITTSRNGVTNTESKTKSFSKGENFSFTMATSSHSDGNNINAIVRTFVNSTTAPSSITEHNATVTNTVIPNTVMHVVTSVPKTPLTHNLVSSTSNTILTSKIWIARFFKHIFDWFSF